MYKEYLLETIDRRFYDNDITSSNQYLKLKEKVKLMNEIECQIIVEDSSIDRKSTMSGIAYGATGHAALQYSKGGPGSFALAVLSSDLILYRAIRPLFDRCSGSCGAFAMNTPKRQICMAKCNVIVLERGLEIAKKHKLNKHILNKIEDRLKTSKERLKRHQVYAAATGRNPSPKVDPRDYSPFKIPD